MARTLTCPHCQAEFTFEDWSKAASCPSCGRRVSFFAASGMPEPEGAGAADGAPAPSGSPATVPTDPGTPVPPGSSAPVPPASAGAIAAASGAAAPATAAPLPAAAATPPAPIIRTLFGKPLGWTRGWTVVVVVVAVAIAFLVTARVELRRSGALAGPDESAIAAVKQAKLPDGTPTGDVLAFQAGHDISALQGVVPRQDGKPPRWYVIDRPWRHDVYVSCELPGVATYSWVVRGTTVTPEAKTLNDLTSIDETMKNPPTGPTGLPQVPGL